MKLRKTLSVIMAVLMLLFVGVPAVSAEDEPPVCGGPYLALLEELEATVDGAYGILNSGEGFTPESVTGLYMAIYKAESFLYNSDGTEAEAQALLDELNTAIDGLETPVASGDEIPFTLVQECRIQWYDPETSNSLFLVKSPQEMDAVLEGIYGAPDNEWYPKPVRDEKYNDEYFAENSLVIGLYEFGSGSIRQSIEMLAVEGDTLTVHRSIYYPDGGTDDMQWRYALMEVKNSDIEGVVNVKDSYALASLDWNKKVYGLWGDVNNDSKVNVKDATAVQKHVADIHLLFGINLYLADANSDGDVNIKDATEIQKYTAGFELESDVGKLTKVNDYIISNDTEAALTELYQVIAEAKEQFAPGSNYVEETIARLSEELEKAEALYNSENPDYNEVVAQTAALREAIDGLETPNLDISELVPLMNEAEEIIELGGYTDSSIDALIEAKSNAQRACLWGDTQEEVTQAQKVLEAALDALVSLYDENAREIPFTVAQQCRVWSYNTSGTQLYLVKSPEEMDEVLDTIGGQNTAVYTKPERDEKYNEEFFAENSLIISLNNLRGGNYCWQTIDRVTVMDDTLVVCRTIFKPDYSGTDINYQYALLEVKNSDIEGVTNLENGNNYVYIVNDFEPVDPEATEPEPTEPDIYPTPDEIEIAFTEAQQCRVQGWGDIYNEETNRLFVVRNVVEFEAVLNKIKGSPDDQWEPKPVRDEKYNDEYFMSDSLIVALYVLGSGSYTFSTDKLTVDGETLTIHRTIYMPSASTCDMNYQYVLIEVNAFDVRQVNNICVETAEQMVEVD